MKNILNKLSIPGETLISGAPQGFDAQLMGGLAQAGLEILFVARDDLHLARLSEALTFFAPQAEQIAIPAWDCLPYDRVSPNGEIISRRIDALTRLTDSDRQEGQGRLILTTVSALLQKVPPRRAFAGQSRRVAAGDRIDPQSLIGFFLGNGYGRVDTVREPGEFAVRGGIVDVYPSGQPEPVRLDFFGDEVDGIRQFDAVTQLTTGTLEAVVFKPVSEILLDEATISRFRSAYREQFGIDGGDDPLYEAISAGHRHGGMEHWLPLFHDGLETLFDYLPDAAVLFDHQAQEARDARLDQIIEYYQARLDVSESSLAAAGGPYHPVPPESLFLGIDDWQAALKGRAVGNLLPFAAPESDGGPSQQEAPGLDPVPCRMEPAYGGRIQSVDAGGRAGRDFSDARVQPDVNVFDALHDRIRDHHGEAKRVVLTAFTQGSRERLLGVLGEHGITGLKTVVTWTEAADLDAAAVPMAVVGLEQGFSSQDTVFISEQDILGDRLSHPSRPRIKPENFIAEASSLGEGDIIVHAEHGIARYVGLEAIEVGGAAHDCLRLVYAGDDKLFLPVENIELVSRYGSETAGVQLDRLGGASWQARKAKLKERIRDMADELIKVAAARTLRPAESMLPPEGLYDEFCARFPFDETDDQQRAIDDTIRDLGNGRPTDRLVCGDVGFGKTEVALRAAFAAVMSGKQVAVVVPTTLLCRQHYQTFSARFDGYPVRVEQLSRMVTAKRAKDVKAGLTDGTVDIVVGTHALVAKDVRLRDLGLLIIDEEQHFGVAHKERLKQLKADVHVLTLTATPIPRTLQLALSGVREMSLIATPPVDRLAVRTFVLPFDPVVVREAIQREIFRGGQVFYVCPRVDDLHGVVETLREMLPDARLATVHGRLPISELEAAMSDFYDGKINILVSTNIIESGLDLPSVNTIIIHRADMFGLAQLYQLRGRVGRSKVRAYAYLTLPPRRKITPTAEKRLEVMQTLDTLGAGFSLASHDLDIRGAGNLLGEEQSGHIREVGIELYQQMLEEAVAEARGLESDQDGSWSPQIRIGMPVLIPETYVPDLHVRMSLYRRAAALQGPGEIESFAAEMIDRFGSLPDEAENLLKTVAIKRQCFNAGIEKVEAGPKGAVVSFRNNEFSNPAGLVEYITSQVGTAKLRPDHKLVFMRAWDDADDRLAGVNHLMGELVRIAAA